ncbi:polymer-forming cytoskeletal protein [Natronomonas gomsonensis]|uniref:bactofilin family protein n=1 Tax=Natronomonas gomsonensis TaxID=1046043 RepID=UPI0015BA663E|nr:polymer-forming cytoskeletal protein [Natronomonas gomsonensis]
MRRSFALLFALVLAVALLPGIAAADTRVGGSVVVDGNQTGDVSAAGGTVVVTGTVDGDLRVYGGDVRIAEGAEVTGIVRAYGGDVYLNGTVGGNALAYAGSVTLGESGSVDRSFGAVAGDVTIAGTVGGDANVFAGRTTLAETAVVEGGLTYGGELVDEGGTVEGITQGTSDLALVPPLDPLLTIFGVFMFVGDLLLGVLLVYAAPKFADAAARTVWSEPFRTAGTGLLAVVGTALAVVVLAVTLVGLPLAVALLALALVCAWVAAVYGQYAVGAWALSYTDYDNRYLAVVIGVVAVTVLGFLPYVGPLLQAVVFLLGAGVVALGARRIYELVSRNRGGLAEI